MSTKLIKVLSIVTTVLGIGVTLVSALFQDKKLEQLVVKEVEKKLSRRTFKVKEEGSLTTALLLSLYF